MLKKYVFVLALLPSAVLAQQQLPTAIDRISSSLGQCVGMVEQRVDQITDLQKRLDAANARIKELEKPSAAEPNLPPLK